MGIRIGHHRNTFEILPSAALTVLDGVWILTLSWGTYSLEVCSVNG